MWRDFAARGGNLWPCLTGAPFECRRVGQLQTTRDSVEQEIVGFQGYRLPTRGSEILFHIHMACPVRGAR